MKHRKQIKHYHTPGELHEFTFSCYDSIPLLTNDKWCEVLARSLDDAGRAEQINLVAFVFMPEHVHLLVYPRRDEPDLPGYLAQMKRGFSDQLQQILSGQQSRLLTRLTVTERPGKDAFRCWEEGAGYDRNIFSKRAMEASISYLHNNPVRRGLCQQAVNWKWPSARYYLLNPPRQQFTGLPYVLGLPEGALD